MISILAPQMVPQALRPEVSGSPLRQDRAKPGTQSASAAPTALGRDNDKAVQAQRKALAQKRMNSVRERMRALSLMIKMDPRAALKMAAELAKELRGAIKAYQEAGGRNVSSGEMALIRRHMSDASDARDEAGAIAAEARVKAEAAPGDEGLQTQARALSGMAEQAGQRFEELEALEAVAVADFGFFDVVKQLVGGLRKARDEIRGKAAETLNPPTEDDWKAADAEQRELERALAFSAGAPRTALSA